MKTKNKIYQIIIIFLLIALFLVVFLIYPTLKDIKNNSKQILSNKGQLLFIDAENMELDNFKQGYKDYEPNLKKIDQLFIDPQNPIDFIKFLEKTASNSNISVEINLIPPQKNKNGDDPPTTFFQIYTKGDFLNILKFSERLEMGYYLIRINSFTIKKSDQSIGEDKSFSNRVDADFSIETINK